MNKTVETEIVIVGGGVAGLWLLNRLRQQGFSALLLESAVLGGEQTHKAQGIIHGGMKYALQGMITPAADAIATMPHIWQACLQGQGDLDLRHVPVLSRHQYLWTTGALASKLAGFFAEKTLQGNVKLLSQSAAEFPAIFKNPQFKGQVYSLDEMVVDVHALIKELVRPNQDVIFKIDPLKVDQLQFDAQQLIACEIHAACGHSLQLKAKKYIFTAGSGNAIFLKKMLNKKIKMQLRPLHMVMVKHDFPDDLYAHCLGLSTLPRLSITTHQARDEKKIWYIGGQLAEEGVKRDAAKQIEVARQELNAVFPWLDFSKAQFTSFLVNRAEALQPSGYRPDSCFMEESGNCIVAWPTKLAFAPLLARKIIQRLKPDPVTQTKMDLRQLRAWPMPAIAQPMWDPF